MQRIKYVNAKGEELILSSIFPMMVSNITGIGGAAATNSTGRGFEQDGESYYSTMLEARLIGFDVYIQGDSGADLADKKHEMMRVFNPKLGMGTLYYYEIIDGQEVIARQIKCVCDGEIIYGEKLSGVMQKFSITMLAPDPSFQSIAEYQTKMVGFSGGLALPFEMPFVLAEQGDSAEIEYEGNIDGALLIEFRGQASRPKIVLEETGEEIEVEVDIDAGESLFIDTTPYDVDVYKIVGGVRVNANNYVKPTSDYFLLKEGINTISFSAASGEPEVYIRYREKYLGC